MIFRTVAAALLVVAPSPPLPPSPPSLVSPSIVARVVGRLQLVPPVEAPIVDRFRAPGCQWCAGNRGLEYGVGAGVDVRAAAPGVVSFSGTVAGVRYVVVDHGGGFRTTYGRLASATVSTGAAVATGQVLGSSGSSGVFFGLRHNDVYLDPELYFVGARPTRARLVP
jgi:murein DD-endopeptidase MepM/ murein hydrolase activator NlpD